MGQIAARAPSTGDESYSQQELSAMLNNRSVRAPNLGVTSFPKNCRQIVGDYISDDDSDPTRCALLGERHINLCLSQNDNVGLDSCWYVGCLSPDDEFESVAHVEIDKTYLLEDHQACLDLVFHENSVYYSIAIDVLVFLWDVTSADFLGALNNLQWALEMLKKELSSVQHVIFAIGEDAFCYFSLNYVTDSATGQRQAVDRQVALKQILSDLRTYWTTKQTLSAMKLLDYYILQDGKPESEKYLSKFAVALHHAHNGEVLDAVDPSWKSSKLMWVCYIDSSDEPEHFDQQIARRCHALHLKTWKFRETQPEPDFLQHPPSFRDNPFIERIVIASNYQGDSIELPRPNPLLPFAPPYSALIELTLKGDRIVLDLTQLNNGYFQNLTHLSFIGAISIHGHLDSQSVPSLKKLILDLRLEDDRVRSELNPFIREHFQSIIHSGLPWQLAATEFPGGWSLASYDEPISNPRDEVKEDAPYSSPLLLMPFIRKLILVATFQESVEEWQVKLRGSPPMKAFADNQNNRLLVWAPERVQEIYAFGHLGESKLELQFTGEIPGERRILTSLECQEMDVVLDGDALPNLTSFSLSVGKAIIFGAFSSLESLSFKETDIHLTWEVSAPLLRSLNCFHMWGDSENLSLRPSLLPQLSYLRITPWNNCSRPYPTILVDEGGPGVSLIDHVVFDQILDLSPYVDQCQMHCVSHLELAVNAWQLPAGWKNTEWQCKTLKLSFYTYDFEYPFAKISTVIELSPAMPYVKTLMMKEKDCRVILNREMPSLTDLTVTSPEMLGPKLKCPELLSIRFTGKLEESDKKWCLNRATYEAIGARPRWVYFEHSGEVNRMLWDLA